MKVTISNHEIRRYLEIDLCKLPLYASPLINLANQYAQGTRPEVVGQMTELMKQFSGRTCGDWEKWYLERHSDAIRRATEKILKMLQQFKETIEGIDESLVER